METIAPTSFSTKYTIGSSRPAQAVTLSELKHLDRLFVRIPSGMEEFDRVVGGGIVLGSVNLIGGEPGIGKSTLLTQIVINLLKDTSKEYEIMYICGEESPEQIALRIKRMSGTALPQAVAKRLEFVTSIDADACIGVIQSKKPGMVIVDSIQSMQTSDLTGTAGSVGQLKECTQRFTRIAKSMNIPVFLVGHVTKDGVIAGPKVLEHIVDTVLELSGERSGFFRLLRSVKNRFGATDEVGVFETVETGLREVKNPSAVFLQESSRDVPGSAIVPVLEGTRPVLVEIQALVVPSSRPWNRATTYSVTSSSIAETLRTTAWYTGYFCKCSWWICRQRAWC
ncbi:MAG: repair protein radA protein [Microgenomates group bacterium GW2011_GWA1_46_15]|nr:MAG: repair protein radA protein [Microgenomates group bacterium GW2011_GWA1_46_15]